MTPSLPPWSYILGYGLVLLLALPGLWVAVRRREPTDLFLLAWVAVVALLLYVPFALQRRFITGFHIPLALLAAVALESVVLPRVTPKRRALVTAAILVTTAMTNVFVPLVPVAAVARGQPPLVIPETQAEAIEWLGEQTTWTDTVLAPPDVAHLVPAWAGNRVVYGHPFETIDADEKRATAERFFDPATDSAERAAILAQYDVRYVFDPGGTLSETGAWSMGVAWQQDGVTILAVEKVP